MWTSEEMTQLEKMTGNYTIKVIAKKLKRTEGSVACKISRMGLQGFLESTDLLTMHQVTLMMGVQGYTIRNQWQSNGLRVIRKGRFYVMHEADLLRYLKDHPQDWNATKVTDDSLLIKYQWYKDKRRQDKKVSYFWRSDEISRMRLLRYQGYTVPEIAARLGRSVESVKSRLYKKIGDKK